MKTSITTLVLSFLAVPCLAQVNISVLPGGSVQLGGPSSPGQQYFMERSFDLAQWHRRGSIVPGTGGNIPWSDAPGAIRAFYRIASGPLVAHRVFGFDFEPYVDGQDPRLHTQISRVQMEQRMRLLIPYTDWIRTFRTVDGFEVAGAVAHQLGFSAALGAWIGPETTPGGIQANQQNITNLIAAGQAGEADLLIVGSEALLRNDVPAATLISYMNQVRAVVPSIPITTADVYGKFIDNPNVINACDILMVNIYPFWELQSIEDSMANVHRNFHNTKINALGKPVWISEAGWPSAGQTVGAAVPSPANAAAFFHRFVTWSRANNVPSFYFEAFNETWKATSGEGAVGSNWGVWDKDGILKAGMQTIFDTQFSPSDWNATIHGAGTPAIAFTSVPALGSGGQYISGTVNHVAPFDVLVVLYIKVNGMWYGAKPYSNRPYTAVGTGGGWTTLFDTGGNDINASEFAAFLFPKSYVPQAVGNVASLPAALAANALAMATASRP
jgi:exo-beta-1,3-glucanase (GH17 family)